MPNPKPLSIDEFVQSQSSGTSMSAPTGMPKKMSLDEFIAASKGQATQAATPAAPAPQKSFVDKILGGAQKVSDFFGGKGISDLAGTTIAKATVPEDQKQYVSEGPTDKEVLGSVIQVGSMFIPVGRLATGVGALVKGAKVVPKVVGGATKLAPLTKKAADLTGKVVAGGTAGAAFDTGAALQGEDTGGAATLIGSSLPLIPPALRGVSKVMRGSTPQTAAEVAGRVVQGNTKAQNIAAQALTKLDTSGVKTYDDLFNTLTKEVEKKTGLVDAEFAKSTKPVKLDKLTQIIEGETGKVRAKANYAQDALTQLSNLYKKTRELPALVEIKELIKKAKTVGLTPSEINALARKYGSEFKAKGFSKVGEALTNVSDQAYENTRKGLKELARSFLTTEKARNLDKEVSRLLTTQKLVQKMVEKVSALEQRIKERGILEKIGRAIGTGVDLATGGALRGFLTKFIPSNVGLKTMNSLDLEKELAKNLQLLNRLTKSPDSVIQKFLKYNYDPKNSALPGDQLLRSFFDGK